jgi:hypothetical protein
MFEWSGKPLSGGPPRYQTRGAKFRDSLTAEQRDLVDRWVELREAKRLGELGKLAPGLVDIAKLVEIATELSRANGSDEAATNDNPASEPNGDDGQSDDDKDLKAAEERLRVALTPEQYATVLELEGPAIDSVNEDWFDHSVATRWVFKRAVELCPRPELFAAYDAEVDRGRDRQAHAQERLGKKYQWLAYYEFLARVADNFLFRGRFHRKEDGY